VARAFTPKRVAGLEPAVERLTAQLLDALPTTGPIDIRNGFTVPLPINVIADMLGVPEEHWVDVSRWTTEVVKLVEPLVRWDPTEVDRAYHQLYDLYGDLADQRRTNPTDDLLSALVDASEDGDRLTNDELVAMVATLMGAGFETTSGLLGSSILHLARHPKQRQLIIDRPELWPNAVEELLRYDTPVKSVVRRSTAPFQLAGHHIPAGANLLVSLANGHRDTRRYDRPYELHLDRDEPRPLALGHGIHHCLGAALARMEARIGLRALLDRHPSYTIDRVEWRRSMNLRNQEVLVIRPGR
jgi:cytochrome P450